MLQMNDKIIVSSCLAGIPCRYDATAKTDDEIAALVASGRAIPVCPECMAGLTIPRTPAENVGGDGNAVLRHGAVVMTSDGMDVTVAFLRGAELALEVAKKHGAKKAILKAYSPSCGCGCIYDGSFSGKRCKGDGITAAVFKQNGISVESR